MSKLPKIRWSGDDAATVEITGDPRSQEPSHVRIRFPGGELEVVRATDGPGADYWCHVHVRRADDPEVVTETALPGRVVDGRLDLTSGLGNAGDLGDPRLYHLAVRVAASKGTR